MIAEIEYPINLLLLTIGTFLCLTLGLFLLFNKSAKNRANLFLGGLILIIFTYFIPGFLYRFHLLERFSFFINLSSSLGFLFGPLAYFYVRSCTQKGFQLKPVDALHFVPFVLDFLSDIPFFLQSSSEKMAHYLDFIATGHLSEYDWVLVLKSIQGVGYFLLSASLILQYRKHLSNETSSIDTAFHRWMLFFIIILSLPICLLVFYVYSDYNRIFISFVLLSFFVFLLGIYLALLIKPELFHTFPHQMLLPESSEEQKQKYENSKLQEDQKDKYIEKLQTYVKTHKPYLEAELTLAQLSEQIKIPPHFLSQVINEKLGCNFLDFINAYRIEEAKAKLTDPKFSHYTIISTAYEAGFNSKSTFYAVFKKHMGMTPSAYRKSEQKLA